MDIRKLVLRTNVKKLVLYTSVECQGGYKEVSAINKYGVPEWIEGSWCNA